MGNSPSTSGYCSQNHNIPLVCPLDIQGSCDLSVFGDVIRSSESNTNVGLVNFSWSWRLEGSSIMLGMMIGCVLTIITSMLIKHCRKRKRDGHWGRMPSLPSFPWWHQPQAHQPQPMTPVSQPMLPVVSPQLHVQSPPYPAAHQAPSPIALPPIRF